MFAKNRVFIRMVGWEDFVEGFLGVFQVGGIRGILQYLLLDQIKDLDIRVGFKGLLAAIDWEANLGLGQSQLQVRVVWNDIKGLLVVP